jgi:hypothetical protein
MNIETPKPDATAKIGLDQIKDAGAQARVETSDTTINEYATAMVDGATFPPVIVFFDGTNVWLADGFHRVEAARKAGRTMIDAEVRHGNARDAILFGVGANATHGLPRTQADKRQAVERLLLDAQWARWSDRKIAEAAHVDHKTVAKIRRELAGGGEFPTQSSGNSLGGEFPRKTGKPNGNGSSDSLIEDVLRNLSNDVLIAECRRRGLAVADV